jgi:hypothetical protein
LELLSLSYESSRKKGTTLIMPLVWKIVLFLNDLV